MAYRKLAVALNNSGGAWSRSNAAATKAFENRDRLPDLERYLTIAQYYWQVELNRDEVRTAFLNVLDLDPNNLTALNNLALLMNQMNQPEEAERYALRGLEAGTIPVLYANAVRAQVRQGAFDRADSTVSRFEVTSPGHPTAALLRGWFLTAQRDFEGSEAHYEQLRDEFATRRSLYIPVLNRLWAISQTQGKTASAERYGRELVAMADESDEPDDYIVRTVFLARDDLAYRDAPEEGLSKVDAALERYPLETMPLLDRPYLTLAGFYAEAGLQTRTSPSGEAAWMTSTRQRA
jgi:Tfp pilus assembly protein PilF